VVGVGRALQAQAGVSGVAREAARAAALADTRDQAIERGTERAEAVAAGYRLGNGSLRIDVDPGAFARGERVRATVRYEVGLEDLPLLGWARVPLASTQVERVEPYRSRWTGGGQP
jgi:Flp pilus assembly protein TadG